MKKMKKMKKMPVDVKTSKINQTRKHTIVSKSEKGQIHKMINNKYLRRFSGRSDLFSNNNNNNNYIYRDSVKYSKRCEQKKL